MISEHTYRMTDQRRIILEEVRKVTSHPTADEVYEMVRKRLPRISLGTVYRNLDILSKSGLIKKIGPGSPQMRFDGNTKDHYHVSCLGCGSVEDVPLDQPEYSIDRLERAIAGLSEYKVLGHNLGFIGLCPRCMKEGQSSLGEKIRELEE